MPSGAACSAASRQEPAVASWLSAWPLERPRHWLKLVNTAQTEAELAALRRAVQRGCPFGEASWSEKMVRRLGLEMTLRPLGRPRKQQDGYRHCSIAGPKPSDIPLRHPRGCTSSAIRPDDTCQPALPRLLKGHGSVNS